MIITTTTKIVIMTLTAGKKFVVAHRHHVHLRNVILSNLVFRDIMILVLDIITRSIKSSIANSVRMLVVKIIVHLVRHHARNPVQYPARNLGRNLGRNPVAELAPKDWHANVK